MPFGGCFSSFEQAFSSFWKPFGKVLKGEKSGSEQNRTFHFLGFCVHFSCFWSQNTCFLLSKSLIPPSAYIGKATSLKKRLRQYVHFGCGKNIGHVLVFCPMVREAECNK